MDMTPERVAKIPAGNLHVSREEFADVWARAEAEVERHRGALGQYLVGVVWTCEWLAGGRVPTRFSPSGWEMPRSPVRRLDVTAHPEAIEAEYAAAVRDRHSAVPRQAAKARGALATLEWAWHSSGRSPLDMAELAAG
jgi:hypothetical protein